MTAQLKAKLQSPVRTAETCPDCATHVVNVQGIADCPDCDWTA